MTFKSQSHYPIAVTETFSVNFTCYHYINKNTHSHLMEKLIDGSLFQFTNPQTKEVSTIPYPCFYEDDRKKFGVLFIPDSLMPKEKATPSLFEDATNDYSDYHLRVTESLADFFEKINVLDSGMLDTEFECVKLLTHTLLTEQNEISEPSYLFFHEENNLPFIAVFADGKHKSVAYNPHLVKIVHDRFASKLHLEKGKVHCVDKAFATKTLELN